MNSSNIQKLERQLKSCFNTELDINIFSSNMSDFITSLSNSKCLSFSSVFAGMLAATSSICAKSLIKVYENSDSYLVPFPLYIINTGLTSSNKSCCTDLIKGKSFKKLNKIKFFL